jgi:tRNA A37 threonylcarbamoyladenosine dehydratase
MSTKPTNHSEDIQRLIDSGYNITIENNCLVVRDVPYLDKDLVLKDDGVLVDSYPSKDHTFYFSGIPYTTDKKILHVAGNVNGWNGFDVVSQLSFKKSDGKSIVPYTDHYDKVAYYVQVIEAHAKSKDVKVTARKYRPVDTSEIEEIPFQYQDLNSSRAGINHISEKLKGQKIAIIGLGGTGSFILDLISKSSVAEIHVYDDDIFHTHNAFRAPGAASKEILEKTIEKVSYFRDIYSKMHKGIKPHNYRVTPEVIDAEFGNYNFVFISVDANEYKREMLLRLMEKGASFIDCGIAVDDIDGSLNGTVRLTTLTKEKNDHLDRRVHCENNEKDVYGTNIQIAELNALNATLAVIKWKRILGFYHNHENEHHSTYMFNSNSLSNDEKN